MTDQLDLFDAVASWPASPSAAAPADVAEPKMLDDLQLVTAIAAADLRDSAWLSAEAGQRRLRAAVPALAALCRRFTGFGAGRAVPEQVAALEALDAIGGREAAETVARLIERDVFQAPTLASAVRVAARLRATLPADVVLALLRHADPQIRRDACGCVRARPDLIAVLTELLDDLDGAVARAAASALGRLGRVEALPALKKALRAVPSRDIVESIVSVADEEAMVLLGRTAGRRPDLAAAVMAALEDLDHPRANVIAAAVQRQPSCRAQAERRAMSQSGDA